MGTRHTRTADWTGGMLIRCQETRVCSPELAGGNRTREGVESESNLDDGGQHALDRNHEMPNVRCDGALCTNDIDRQR
ncbi:unnamed protein product [Heligmosomoides polygyrus]|uniref:Uncharacterized protein n=1 Tax=Heligmosomoides polygyrus TaxID=6339 RepID=A0A183FVF3_HELPZ|nr:unnamed protein product [Heligmosomoides polygyrus]